MSDRPYVRVYYNDLIRDYPEVWGDDAQLATWLRLLATADPMWPTPPELPRSAKARVLDRLVKSTLLSLLPTHRFRVKGLDEERSRRAEAGRVGGLASGRSRTQGTTVEQSLNDRSTTQRTKSNLDETSIDETRRDEHIAREGLPNLDTEAIRALEHRTGRPAQVAGDKQLTEYDRLIEDHGLEKVLSAMDRLANGQPMTARQLVWGAMKVLEPMVDPRKAQEAELQEERDRNSRRGVEATQRYLQEIRSVGAQKP